MMENLFSNLFFGLIDTSIRQECVGDFWEDYEKDASNGLPLIVMYFNSLSRYLCLLRASFSIISYRYYEKYLNNRIKGEFSKLYGADCESYIYKNIKRYCCLYLKANESFWDALKKMIIRCRLSFLLEEVDQLIEMWDLKFKINGISLDDFVIGSLVARNLVQTVERYDSNEIDDVLLSELLMEARFPSSLVESFVKFDGDNFSKTLLIRTWFLTIYLIGWKTGQESYMHHHGDCFDAIKVLKGEMEHWDISPDEWEKEIPFEGCSSLERYEGSSTNYYPDDVVIIKPKHGHQIANSSGNDLITIHFRFGCPPEDTCWRSTTRSSIFISNDEEKYAFKGIGGSIGKADSLTV